jgi:hypothetical protein
LNIKISVSSFCIFCLAGCGGSHLEFETFDEAMLQEAMCVAAAESFLMYKSADRHLEHGFDYGRLRFTLTHEPNDFQRDVQTARRIFETIGQVTAASVLTKQCDEKLTNAMYDRFTPRFSEE